MSLGLWIIVDVMVAFGLFCIVIFIKKRIDETLASAAKIVNDRIQRRYHD